MITDTPIPDKHYPFAQVEAKWQKRWEERGTYKFHWDSKKPKFYVLTMFSYPSGDKLHMGHWYCYAPTDSFARFKRMQGYEVFEPMGFDAFGLPAENYAIKTGIHPEISTRRNIEFMREQLKRIGAMYDWDYEVDTSSPEYYKWTQWWFLLMYKRGLAYQKNALVNWCPSCQTVLANEQVLSDNTCERCGSIVVRKNLKQWFFAITKYNQRLLDGLDTIDWPDKTKAMQRYWIGKSEGTEIEFRLATALTPSRPSPQAGKEHGDVIRVFTTRADTLFGVTWVVIAPEHPLAAVIASDERKGIVADYIQNALSISDVDRAMADRPKTGVFTGAYCIHPLTSEKLPVWIADYVIGSYGTGAVMAVPAHDERDYQFAKEHGLPIKEVIKPADGSESTLETQAYTEYGIMANSVGFDGLTSKEGIHAVGERLEQLGQGKATITWHLRDWTISRQRFWGAPIPILYCEKCGIVPVPESDLPVRLPEGVTEYKPQGKSPLETVDEFVNTKCPNCGGPAKRDTDTMDTFVDSSWYYMRYPDARLHTAAFDTNHLNKMLPVDQYVGGPEHAMGHLIYSRFFGKVAHDAGYLNYEEPFKRLVHQGIILNKGERMSKSKGNVVAPEPVLNKYGSDVLRCFLMFSGDYTQGGDWSEAGITGIERFVGRVYRLAQAIQSGTPAADSAVPVELDRKLHQTIKAVSTDLQDFHFNTCLARLMELTNAIYSWVGPELKDVRKSPASLSMLEMLAKLLAPLAPHLAEEVWEIAGHEQTIFDEQWPEFDADKAKEENVTIAVQVNGKLRDTVTVAINAPQDVLTEAAMALEKVRPHFEGKQIVKTIVVPNKIVNIVVK
ncbi:MAG TPA: leucine--tRNA ligase [bacterium]|jgi:leucyl-tRNA synthetase